MTTRYEPVIDIDNPAILNELEWIGTGKIYPTTPEDIPGPRGLMKLSRSPARNAKEFRANPFTQCQLNGEGVYRTRTA